MTPAQLKVTVAYRAHKVLTSAGTSRDDLKVNEWVKSAIRYIQECEDWSCHRDFWSLTASTTPALAAGTAAYNLGTLKSDFRKLVGDSVRYGRQEIEYEDDMAEMARRLGRDWRDSGVANGVPKLCCLMGKTLYIGPKPSQSFITQYSSIEGEYFVTEDISSASWLTTSLRFWEDFYNYLVDVAMIFADYENDESQLNTALSQWNGVELTRLRGFDPAPVSKDQLADPILFGDSNFVPGGLL